MPSLYRGKKETGEVKQLRNACKWQTQKAKPDPSDEKPPVLILLYTIKCFPLIWAIL